MNTTLSEAGVGWIEWTDGDCPVDGDTLVEWQLKEVRSTFGPAKAKTIEWRNEWRKKLGLVEIVAYRRAFVPDSEARYRQALIDIRNGFRSDPMTWASTVAFFIDTVLGSVPSPNDLPCQDCDGPVPSWRAPNQLWNYVMGGPEAKDDPGGYICPTCFMRRAAAAGVSPPAWLVSEPPTAAGAGEAVASGKYDEVLRPFFAMMEAELHANCGKGDRPGWLAMSRDELLLEIYYHLAKLQKATRKDDGPGIREFGADVANMSMMLVDRCEQLVTPARSLSSTERQ